MTDPATLPVNAIEVHGLEKTYAGSRKSPPKTALRGVDLVIPRGSMFGLLGPNGAGKSTLINILAGVVNKTGGTAAIWGRDIDRQPRDARAALGVVPQEIVADVFFTPREALEVQAGFYGVPASERRSDELLAALGLSDKAHAYVRALSGGMKRRLMVAKALVHNPPVLILDEPTAGVDIELRQSLWAYVRELNAKGTTVILTTHYLQEAEELCDRIAIINHGKLIANESKTDLLARLDAKELRLTLDCDIFELPAKLVALDVKRLDARTLSWHYRPSAARIDVLLAAVRAEDLAIADVSTRESDLEDLFLQLTRKTPDAA